MSLTAAELRAVYVVDEGPLDKSLNNMGGKVSSTFGKVAAAAAGFFAFDKLKDGFFSVTGAASDLEGTVSKSNAIFGQNAAVIDQWAKGAAVNLGLSRQQALAAAAGFGDMFSQIGFSAGQATDMSKAVVQMSADLGAFNDLETEDVAQRISAAFRGEYDSLQALIPNINAARVEQEALAATGKKATSELTAQEKAAAVLAIVNKDGARAIGAFARESDSAAGSAKTATALWNDQKAAIGERLLPAFTALMGFLSGTAIPAVGRLASFIANDVVPALQDMAAWVEKNKTPILIIAGVIGAVLLPHLVRLAAQSVISWTTARVEAVKTAAASVAASYKMIAGWVAARAAAVASFGQTIAIMAMYAAQAVANAAKAAAAWVAAQVRTVASLVATAAAFVAQGAVMAASMAANAARVVAGWVLMGAQALIQGARMAAAWVLAMGPVGWVIAAVVGLVALIVANWDTVVAWTKTAWSAVTGAVAAAWEWIKGAVKAGVDFLVNLFLNFTPVGLLIKHWNTIKNTFSSGVAAAVGFVRELPGRIGDIFANAGSWLVSAGRNLLEGLWNGIKGAGSWLWNKVMGWAKGLLDGVKNFFGISSPSKVFAELGKNMGQGLALGIAGTRPAVASELQRLADVDALGQLSMRPPPGVRPGGLPTGPGAGSAVGTAPAGGVNGPLVNIEAFYEQPGSSPAATAQALGVEVRTRPWT